MTPEEAKAIAQEFMDRNHSEENLVVFFVEDLGPAYLCHHNTKKYVETRDLAYAQGPGLAPVCVPKDGSAPWMLLGAFPFEQQVAEKYGAA